MIILGGGITGLTIAWHLMRTNTAKVHTIIESEQFPAASSAAAGMLAPYSEAYSSNPEFLDIGTTSLHLYENFLEDLQKETKIAPSLCSEGTLLIAEDPDGLEWLKNRFQVLKILGAKCHWLHAEEIQEKEPFIGPSALAALHLPQEREILVSQLEKALRLALRAHNIEILSKTVKKIENSWTLIFSDNSQITCEDLIIANGAWANQLKMHYTIDQPKIIPNKGQLIVIRPNTHFSLRHMIRTRHVYICPKNDGTILLGATSEFIGQNLDPTLGNIREILQYTWKILPAIDDAHFISTHTGLRPSSITGLPIIQKGNKQGLYWAIGHGRSGILLAPWTGQKIAKLLNTHERTV